MGIKIKTKAEMYDLLISGKLGNTVKMWRTVEEAILSGWTDTVGIRCIGRPGMPHVMHCPLDAVYRQAERLGIRRDELLLNEDPPYDIRIFNGEVSRTPIGLSLKYNDKRGMLMRTAMNEAKFAIGLDAFLIMDHYMQESDVNMICELMRDYDGATDDCSAVVEFSVFDTQVGWMQGSRIVIWEVRSY